MPRGTELNLMDLNLMVVIKRCRDRSGYRDRGTRMMLLWCKWGDAPLVQLGFTVAELGKVGDKFRNWLFKPEAAIYSLAKGENLPHQKQLEDCGEVRKTLEWRRNHEAEESFPSMHWRTSSRSEFFGPEWHRASRQKVFWLG